MAHPDRGPGLYIDRVRSGKRKGCHNVSFIGKDGNLKWSMSAIQILTGAIGAAGTCVFLEAAILSLLPKK